MNKTIVYGILAVGIVAGGFLLLNSYIYKEKQGEGLPQDFKEALFTISGEPIALKNGLAEVKTSLGGDSTTTIRYFGNTVSHDIDGDGEEDIVFLVTQETGGSGTFFYAVGALKREGGYIGSKALFLGDRIAPQTTEAGPGRMVIINFAERAPGEPMTTQPSMGKSMRILLDSETLEFGEVLVDFEGEADPGRMTLDMKTWEWVGASYNDGRSIVPRQPNRFSLKFSDEGTFSASTDCNGIGGEYSVQNGTISFNNMMSTLMYCEGSQETDFRLLLENAGEYHFTSKGELVLSLKFDSGSATFR